MRGKFLAYLGALSLLGACGYNLKREESSIAASFKGQAVKVHVPVVDNITSQTGIELVTTTSLREALAMVQDVTVVSDPEEADMFLLGKIVFWNTAAGRGVRTGNGETQALGGLAPNKSTASDFKVYLTLEVSLVQKPTADNPKFKTHWTRAYKGSGYYTSTFRLSPVEGATSAPMIHAAREQIQLKKITQDLASQIVEQVSFNF